MGCCLIWTNETQNPALYVSKKKQIQVISDSLGLATGLNSTETQKVLGWHGGVVDPDWFKSSLVLSVWISGVSPVSVRWTHILTGDSKLTVRVCLSVFVRALSQSEILR